MLIEFWESKKQVIQLVGILTGVGALFLRIPLPADEKARIALLNIQLFWLLVITISVLILFWNFYKLALKAEEHIKVKFDWDAEQLLTLIIIIFAIWFIFNLWGYTLSLYQESLQKLLIQLQLWFGITILSLSLYLAKKLYTHSDQIKGISFFRKLLYKFILFALIILPGFMVASWNEFAHFELNIYRWLRTFLLYSGLVIVIILIKILFNKIKSKRNLNTNKNI